ncbi:MAG TPA: response regulator transcription factor [Steroidobacteraceae bacterium]|nr:response regulator transcription factor [Steroidobacteraceae bacterium]
MWKTVLSYGLALAAGTLALQWFEYRFWARTHAMELYVGLLAAAFLGLGVWVGARLFARRAPAVDFEPNERARESLGITDRELDVLRLLAAGRSNKEIARQLEVSPNTVKTHVARLFGKLGAGRRTAAVRSARELGLIP